ncbi:hypothetical protein ACFWMG_09105 [Streptomyces sp. NPDC127074]|uniref:hypothetical protein n=2 Tax=unclassified Streptomyces TaxID=2593676 RepID=UPI0036495EF6
MTWTIRALFRTKGLLTGWSSCGGGEADLESFDFAEPAVAAGFADAFAEVLADLDEAGPLTAAAPPAPATFSPTEEFRRGKPRTKNFQFTLFAAGWPNTSPGSFPFPC